MDILYHYCSTKAFLSIIEKQEIWLSSLKLSNDTMEGKLVTEIMQQFAKKENFNTYSIDHLQRLMSLLEKNFDGFGMCFSKKGDLLSQWRGYSDDGAGVAIGFSKNFLESIPDNGKKQNEKVFFDEVKYSITEHEDQIRPIYDKIKKNFQFHPLNSLLIPTLNGNEKEIYTTENTFIKNEIELLVKSIELSQKLFFIKKEAFSEEMEWRLVYLLDQDNNCYHYRTNQNKIIPYLSIEIPNKDMNPIEEIILGPKHPTPVNVIINFLKTYGFTDVKVRKSEATYR